MPKTNSVWLLVGGVVLFTATVAVADISPVILHIGAANSSGRTVLDVTADRLVPDPALGGRKWVLTTPVSLASSPANVVATLNSATLRIVDNPLGVPRILLGFEIRAGAEDAQFTVLGPVVSFPWRLAAANARATASFTLTDFDDGRAAELEGLNPAVGLGMYTAQYNGAPPDGATFANLIEELSVDEGGTVTASGTFPPAGFAPVGVTVDDISVLLGFRLTAGDLMSTYCTSTYVAPLLRGDCDCDGVVSMDDIDYFVRAISDNYAGWNALYALRHGGAAPTCNFLNCDITGDGHVTFADIDPFVALLSGRP